MRPLIVSQESASRLTQLPVHIFLQSFNTSFPQPTSWRVSLLPSRVTPRLHTMLLTKKSPKASLLLDYEKTPWRGNSGTPSAHGCASQPITEASRTRSSSYKYLLTRSTRVYLMPTTSPSTNEAWNNTSAPWDKSSRPWGPLTQDSTTWAQSTFAWDNSLRQAIKKIVPPEDSASSPSPSSTAWTQLPTVALQETKLSQTLHGSPSSSSSDPRHTVPVGQIPSPPLQPARHPVLCGKSTHPIHHRFRRHLCRRYLR